MVLFNLACHVIQYNHNDNALFGISVTWLANDKGICVHNSYQDFDYDDKYCSIYQYPSHPHCFVREMMPCWGLTAKGHPGHCAMMFVMFNVVGISTGQHSWHYVVCYQQVDSWLVYDTNCDDRYTLGFDNHKWPLSGDYKWFHETRNIKLCFGWIYIWRFKRCCHTRELYILTCNWYTGRS